MADAKRPDEPEHRAQQSPSSWSLAEVGNFNGQGTADILWRNSSTGADLLWVMSNGAIASSLAVNTVPTNFTVVNNGHLTGE